MSELLSLLTDIVATQEETNNSLDPNWRSANYNFRLAASQELSELIDQLPWKWWKSPNQVDLDQVHLEVIDITHFIIADLLIYFKEPELVAKIILDAQLLHRQLLTEKTLKKAVSDVEAAYYQGFNASKMTEQDKYKSLITQTYKLHGRLLNCSTIYLPDVLIELLELYELDLNDLAKIFFSKNTLNLFRYKNGFREGTYTKNWVQVPFAYHQSINGTKFAVYEDNVVLQSIVDGPLAGYDWGRKETRKLLYEMLEDKYKTATGNVYV